MRLLAMSGLVPEQICDTIRFTGYAGERVAAHYCGYASDFISMVRKDDSLDGAVFPRSCDSSRILKNYLLDAGKFAYQLAVPARQDTAAIEYFADGLRDYKNALEDYFCVTITDEQVRVRSDTVNARNRELKKIYDQLEEIPYGQYLRILHEILQNPLLEQKVPDCFKEWTKDYIPSMDVHAGTAGAKRVFLVGSTLCNVRITELIEECGLKIVGDNLPESGRLCAQPEVELGGDVYLGIASSLLKGRLSPTQDCFKSIMEKDFAQIKRKAVRCVLFVTQKYCEPYDYLFYVYKKMLDAEGIPVIKISLTDSMDDQKTGLVVEAIADMI